MDKIFYHKLQCFCFAQRGAYFAFSNAKGGGASKYPELFLGVIAFYIGGLLTSVRSEHGIWMEWY